MHADGQAAAGAFKQLRNVGLHTLGSSLKTRSCSFTRQVVTHAALTNSGVGLNIPAAVDAMTSSGVCNSR